MKAESISRLLAWDAACTQRLGVAGRPGVLRTLAILLAHSGDSWFWLVGLGLAWYFGSPEWKKLVTTMVLGILITAALVFAVKLTVRRQRPAGEWGEIYRKTDPHSFPSGHAARAFMLAVVAVGAGPTWFGLILLVWAPLVTLARVAMGVHYVSDVIAGALLGLAVGAGIIVIF